MNPLLIAERFADNKYHGVNVSNKGIKTISEHPYTDAIESDGWFDFNVDAIHLNKSIADVDARFEAGSTCNTRIMSV